MKLLSEAELEAALRDIGARRYHRLHPFHKMLHGGACTKGQVQAWALNRYYYQAMIPVKDASLIARCHGSGDPPRMAQPSRRSRRQPQEGEGGIARWLKLTDGLGLDRDDVVALDGLLPATRFAVDAYVHFVREKSLLEAIASSLTELFSPQIISERIAGMLENYAFVTPETLAYFAQRPPQAERDARFALDYVKTHARTAEAQQSVLAALELQMRRTVGDAGCALSRLCRAEACSTGRLRATGLRGRRTTWRRSDDRERNPNRRNSAGCQAAAAARGPAGAQRGAGRMGAACAGTHLQGRRDRDRGAQALHRRNDVRSDRRRSARKPIPRRATHPTDVSALLRGLAERNCWSCDSLCGSRLRACPK